MRSKARLVTTAHQRAIAFAINSLEPAVSEALVAELRRRRYTMPRDFIEQAIAVGELPRGTDAALVADLLLAPIYYRALVLHEPVPSRLIEQTVTIILAGIGSKTSKRR